MRLYLSSFRMGDHPERLVSLLGRARSAAVIANAIDYVPAEERAEGLRRELDELAELGIEAEELDLRDYFDRPYSAGPCMLGPTLRRFELVDEPEEVSRMYGVPPIWDGLGVLDYVIVPH